MNCLYLLLLLCCCSKNAAPCQRCEDRRRPADSGCSCRDMRPEPSCGHPDPPRPEPRPNAPLPRPFPPFGDDPGCGCTD